MPRGRRYIVAGHTYHVTHRCHNRAFLLKFKRDRTRYRELLRRRLGEQRISLFSYCITSNHVHLLLRPDPADGPETLSQLMQGLEGDFAQEFNRRKQRKNAFWGDRYHATMIDSGEYLWKCLLYIDLNMVRAGVVHHPREWEWTAYHELTGARQRYRLLDVPELAAHVGAGSESAFRTNYAAAIAEALARGANGREACWTESLAVGSAPFVASVGRLVRNRMKVELLNDGLDDSLWLVREVRDPSGLDSISGPENRTQGAKQNALRA